MNNSQDTMIEQLTYVKIFTKNASEAQLYNSSSGNKTKLQYNTRYYEQFAHYALPHGTDYSHVIVEDAPMSIIFTHTGDGGYLLVQKKFKKRLADTPNNIAWIPSSKKEEAYVMIRMLVGLPNIFSLKEAIHLGESNFWQDYDAQKTLSLRDLKNLYIQKYSEMPVFSQNTYKKINIYIPFIIQSYLLQKFVSEQQGHQKPRILIIAPPDLVTYLIDVLSKSIPSQLLQNTTFSTYEYDIQSQKYDICGTCLLQEHQHKYERYLNLSTTYKNDFVLNTYTQNTQVYKPTDLPSDIWEATSRYADFVSKAFTDVSPYTRLHQFIKSLERDLSVTTLLDAYQAQFHTTPQIIPLNNSVKTGANSTQRDPASATWQGQEQNRFPNNPAQDPQVPTSSATSYTTEAVPPTAFQQAPTAPDKAEELLNTLISPKEKHPIQQPPEPSEELHLEPTQHLVQDMSSSASSSSADDFPAASLSEEDLDASSQEEDLDPSSQVDTQKHLNASSSLYPSKERSSLFSTKRLSREDILDALYNPRQAEKLLGDESKRTDLIEIMLNDPAWTQRDISPALVKLRKDVSTGKYSKLSSAINKLIHHMHAIAIRAIQENNQIRFQECLFILRSISPYLEDRNLWRTFLYNLSQEQKYTSFLQIAWSYRERLLGIALKVLEPEKNADDKIVQPLLAVDPKDFSKLISESSQHSPSQNYTSLKGLRLPKRWNYLATKAFVASISANDPVVIPNVRYFEKYQEILDSLFGHFISLQEPHMWSSTIIPFFKILVENNYKYQKNILFELLEANTPQIEKIELIKLCQATLLPEDKTKIFQLNASLYNASLYNDALYNEQFLSDPLFREITLDGLPLTWERMNALYLMLEKVPPKKAETVVESLANILNNCIDSPIRLGMLFSSFTRQDNATAISLLLSMAQKSKEEMTQAINDEIASDKESTVQRIQSRFSTYVQFALQLDTSYKGSIKGHDMLSQLLHGADERIFSFLTDEAKYWLPEPRQAWYEQKGNYPSSSQSLEVEDTPITANNPTADLSILYAAIESELTPEQITMLETEENKLMRGMRNVLKRRKARKLSQFWQENYVALQNIKGYPIDIDVRDALKILERAYNYSFAIKNADCIAEGSEKKYEAENAILLAHRDISSHSDNLRFTRKERKRFNLAFKRTEQTQNMHDPTKDKMPHA